MSRLSHIAILLTAATALLLAACNDASCSDNGSSLPLAAFYFGNSQQTITGITVMGIGAPGDSLLANASALNELYLPLRASATTTSYRFVRTGTDGVSFIDTVTIDYQPIEYFHSVECGAMYNFDIKQARCTTHGLDSIAVVTPLVTNSRTPALRIYFKTLTI